MGVDSIVKRYNGWTINVHKLVQYMKDVLGVTETDLEYHGIITSIDNSKLPKGWKISSSCPEYDLEEIDCIYYLCVDPNYTGDNRISSSHVKPLADTLGGQGDATMITAVSWY